VTPALEPHALATMLLAGVAFALFARERVPIETTSLGVLVLLTAGFHLFPYLRGGVEVVPSAFFLGFGHEALVAICALMILGRGLVVTGALDPASRVLGRLLEARPGAAIGAVGPAMGLGDVADDTGPDELTEPAIAVLAMALVAHLGGGLALAGHRAQLAGFGNIVAERLLAEDVLAGLQCGDDRHLMQIIGQDHSDGVQVFLLEHLV